VSVARSQSIFEVGSRDLIWVSDLTSYQVQIFTRHVKLIKKQLLKVWRRCAPPFLRYRKKKRRGVLKNTPRRARVKSPLKKATGHPILIHQQHSQIVKSYSAPTEP